MSSIDTIAASVTKIYENLTAVRESRLWIPPLPDLLATDSNDPSTILEAAATNLSKIETYTSNVLTAQQTKDASVRSAFNDMLSSILGVGFVSGAVRASCSTAKYLRKYWRQSRQDDPLREWEKEKIFKQTHEATMAWPGVAPMIHLGRACDNAARKLSRRYSKRFRPLQCVE